jgi:hypothetical protein
VALTEAEISQNLPISIFLGTVSNISPQKNARTPEQNKLSRGSIKGEYTFYNDTFEFDECLLHNINKTLNTCRCVKKEIDLHRKFPYLVQKIVCIHGKQLKKWSEVD